MTALQKSDGQTLTVGPMGQIERGSVTVAQMVVTNNNHARMVADRNLFIAAPCMLKELRRLERYFNLADDEFEQMTPDERADCKRQLRLIRAAIAKATGASS